MSPEGTTPHAPTSRRQFLRGLGVAGAGVALASCAPSTTPRADKPNLDVDILNFALNLEYLETAFYLMATGRIRELGGLGGNAEIRVPDGVTGLAPMTFQSGDIRDFANELATNELSHVRFLIQTITALGGVPIPRPVLDIGPAFTAAANAATGGRITDFNPFRDDTSFLLASHTLEDVGVTAYKGASPLIRDRKPGGVLEQAAGILAVEGYHMGSTRYQLYKRRAQEVAPGLTVAQVSKGISDLRDSLDGAADKDQGIADAPRPNESNIVPTDENGVAFSRAPREVLNIVYQKADAASGGFFPNGVNGNLK
ncbi:ferritin-like domain-containing protein [Deinococcus maricopensis]|uniref:Twin-arginine translocation pathway signal n=1 Tax=Deinococcus maricopensis (strain DSM 21211 / LMG 22137 / NRRL B-23946 / LB-34) TaxID=709986 RepID=E8U9S8_DEIML|nr:ferritin-like domain-containing protein [Deinococcus maricopensis]ADV67817.1 twin-arginine translocation pathway signal [Deinococcus maricopensis DSM 21211]